MLKNEIKIMTSSGEKFKIEFDIKVTKLPSDWMNVFHVTANGDKSQYGDRIPAVFVYSDGKLYIHSAVDGNTMYEYTFEVELGKLYHIIIQHYKGLYGFGYWYEIIIDGEQKVKIENTQHWQSFSNVKFYASDQWYDPFSSEFGCIGKITISK